MAPSCHRGSQFEQHDSAEGKSMKFMFSVVLAALGCTAAGAAPTFEARVEGFAFHPSTIVIDEERANYWLEKGAQPSERVAGLLRIKGIKATGS